MIVKMRQIPGFDLLKFIMSLFIVAVHMQLSDTLIVSNYLLLGRGVRTLQNLGVPTFFVISSYLFFRKCYAVGV